MHVHVQVLHPPRLRKPYPFPITLTLIYEALKLLRVLGADADLRESEAERTCSPGERPDCLMIA